MNSDLVVFFWTTFAFLFFTCIIAVFQIGYIIVVFKIWKKFGVCCERLQEIIKAGTQKTEIGKLAERPR